MPLRNLTITLAGVGVLLILASPPPAWAYVRLADTPVTQDLDRPSGTDQFGNHGTEQGRNSPPGHVWNGRPGRLPRDQGPTRPIPEPGTMALVSLGLLSLGAFGRKRRMTRTS